MSDPGVTNDQVESVTSTATRGQPGTIKAKRNIGGLVANVVVEEVSTDQLAITQHPVEKTADITDHAYPLPPILRVRLGYSPSGSGSAGANGDIPNAGDPVPLQSTYQQYLDMQSNRELLEVQTGKRLYEDMLIRTITMVTDVDTENALLLELELQHVILVDTQTVQVPQNSVQKAPQDTGNQLSGGTKSAVPSPSTYNDRGATGLDLTKLKPISPSVFR